MDVNSDSQPVRSPSLEDFHRNIKGPPPPPNAIQEITPQKNFPLFTKTQVQKEHHIAMGKVKRDAVTLEFSQADLGEGIAEAILVKAPTRGAGGPPFGLDVKLLLVDFWVLNPVGLMCSLHI